MMSLTVDGQVGADTSIMYSIMVFTVGGDGSEGIQPSGRWMQKYLLGV